MGAVKSGRPILAGVVGYPVGHSLSPAVHGYWLRQLGIHGYYIPMEVPRQDFTEVIQTLPKMGFRGVNVTVPHKESALQMCDSVSDQAALIGAVNTLTISDDGKIHGDNTDAYGFLQSLEDGKQGWRADDGPILVLGAGGAARGVIYALISGGAQEVHIANRTRERAELLKGEYGVRVTTHSLGELDGLAPQMGTVINATSLGMEGKPPLPFPYECLSEGTTALDLVYTPLETEFLREARQRGCIAVDGLGMLLHQAAQSFYHWFNIQPDVDDLVRNAALSK